MPDMYFKERDAIVRDNKEEAGDVTNAETSSNMSIS